MALINSFSFALKRLWSHRWLVLCLAVGLTVAVALAVAVPLYADSIHYALLSESLERSAAATRRSPFTFIFHYVGAWYDPVTLEQYQPVDAYLSEQMAGVIGLPLDETAGGVTRYVATDNIQLYPNGPTIRRSERIDLVRLTYVEGIFENIQLVEGELPRPAGENGIEGEDGVIEVLVSLAMANELGLQAGDVYRLQRPGEPGEESFQMRMRISGIWAPLDESSSFWFYPPGSFDKKPLVPEETFFEAVAPRIARPVYEAVWSLSFDGSGVHSEDVPGLLRRVSRAQTEANALLPHTDLEASPVTALRGYRQQALGLTNLLFVVAAPVLGLALYFLGLVAAMLVRRQRNEIAVLRSRGASQRWVAGVYLLEWSLLGVVGLAAGPWFGMAVARLVGQTESFLVFSTRTNLALRLTPGTVTFGLLSVGLALVFSLVPAWQAGKFTIISYKQERARASRRPLWQRAYLDLIVLAPALYGLYTLRAQGKLQLLGRTLGSSDPFENPLLFLLPTLFIVALSLLVLRILPYLLLGLAWLAAQFPGTVPVLALRQLARSSGAHTAPLMLLIITLSLAGFVASMAHTLDRSLADSVYYAVGADLNLVEGGEYTGEEEDGVRPQDIFTQGGPQPPTRQISEAAVWNFLPASDHLNLPGVEAVARVGRYSSRLHAGGRSASGRLLGIDRVDFPNVAFFRPDFGSEHLVALMNRLASEPSALLVDRRTWEQYNLSTGDTVEMTVDLSQRQRLPFKVAGFVEYFPTMYPEDGPFFIANLDYIFESAGGLQPYDVWLRTAPDADSRAIVSGIQALGVAVLRAQDARQILDDTLNAPNRQGMLGLLSVGFLAASVLTVIGFLLYAVLSFRERFVQLGVLRALGLSMRQMAAALALEQFILILAGIAAGTMIAVLAASLFIPHLPVTFGSHPGTPPNSIQIGWIEIARVYLIFAAVLVLGVSATLWSLRRMKVFQAVKMGENV